MRDRIEIDKSLCPYVFDIEFGDDVFIMELLYNSFGDLFTMNLRQDDDTLICAGEKLVFGYPIVGDVYIVDQYPMVTLVPLDESGAVLEVNHASLGERVFITLADLPWVL